MEKKKKLLDLVRDKIRFKHYSYSTERTYIHWIKQYIFFHNKKHPVEMGKEEIEAFLTFLATKKKVSPTTQNQAFNAILFLYKEVLGTDMSEWNVQALRAQERKHIRIIKDLDFGFDKLYIWDSKSLKDRTVPLPLKLKEELQVQVARVQETHRKD